MPTYIIKLVDKQNKAYYLEWSTVVDSPVTTGADLNAFKEWYYHTYGASKMRELEVRLERVERKGTSSLVDADVNSLISFNRAGPEGCILSYNELVRFYCLGEERDADHPCWKARHKAIGEIYEAKGGADYKDLDELFTKYPYPEKTDGSDVLPSV